MPSSALDRILRLTSLPLPFVLFATLLHAQAASHSDWVLRTRAFIVGGSHAADPRSYKAYSGLGLEAALDRVLTPTFAVSLTLRVESREIDSLASSGPDTRLGSVELLPISVLAQYYPRHSGIQPYLGIGGNVTMAWEKTGQLDSLKVKPSVGPAFQAGLDLPISSRGAFNLDVRWNTQRLRVGADRGQLFSLKIDPLTIGIGVGLRF